MKKNRLLVLSLLACTLLAGCDENTFVQNGENPVGNVGANGSTLDTNLTLQKFYEDLKTSNGGSIAVEKLLDMIAEIEYSDEFLAHEDANEAFSVKSYHTTASLQKEITERFETLVEEKSYFDDDGNFDPEKLKEYVVDSLDFEVTEGTTNSKYINDAELVSKLGYNYDAYIEEEIKPAILRDYVYLDYLTGSSKYKGQFSNQYAVKLEVLKIKQDSTKLNGSWNESLIKDVKAVTSGNGNVTFGTDYSFVTFNSDNQLIVFESKATGLEYSVYNLSEEDVEAFVPSYQKVNGTQAIRQLDFTTKAVVSGVEVNVVEHLRQSTKDEAKSWTITPSAKANKDYYEKVEDILIARELWKIDREVVLAKNYDFKTSYYDAMTETEKDEAKGFASTYTNSNAKPLKEVAKSKKISVQQSEYYYEPDYYTKSTYSSVLPSTLSSLRGTSAKDIISHLVDFGTKEFENDNKFLLPVKDSLTDPVYLDVSSSTYYVCEVSDWYGFYKYQNLLDSSKPSKQISNYQIEAYQSGQLTEWTLNETGTKYIESTDKVAYQSHPEAFESVIELVQVSAKNILTEAMKKEAVVALFEKYELEINDQDIYDYISSQYPDYFDEED